VEKVLGLDKQRAQSASFFWTAIKHRDPAREKRRHYIDNASLIALA